MTRLLLPALALLLTGCAAADHPATRAAGISDLPPGDPVTGCEARAEAYLNFFGVASSDIVKFGHTPVIEVSPNNETIVGHNQHVTLGHCPENGRVVLRMDDGCRLMDAWTTGNCPVDGLGAY